jgi:hypothetical protein
VGADQDVRDPDVVATASGEVLASCVTRTGRTAEGRPAAALRVLRLTAAGRPGGEPVTVSDRDERVQKATWGTDVGAAYVAWVADNGRSSSVRARRIAPGLQLGRPRSLSGDDDVMPAPPQLAMRPSGRAAVAWITRGSSLRYAVRR